MVASRVFGGRVCGVVQEANDGLSCGGVPREQKMLKGHLPRVTYPQTGCAGSMLRRWSRVVTGDLGR